MRTKKSIRGILWRISGELFLYNPRENAVFFRIREPYYSSGKKYGWNPPIGLGINKTVLMRTREKNSKICVFVGNKKDRYYQTDSRTWIKFAEEHGSIEVHKNTVIYIIQFSPKYFKTIYVKNDD